MRHRAPEAARLREIVAELDVLRLDRPPSLTPVLPAIRRLLELDTLLCLSPVERPGGWATERFECDNFASGHRFRDTFVEFLARTPGRYAWYDAKRPEPAQRNQVLDALDIIPPGQYEASEVYAQVIRPHRLERHRQLRALVCDGASLLGWFGAFHDGPITVRQRRLLSALVPAVRRRLSIERRLERSTVIAAALETALDELGAPAFVIGGRGEIIEMNLAGGALHGTRRQELEIALSEAVAGRANPISFELTAMAAPGMPPHWLAIFREPGVDARIAAAMTRAIARFRLTRRQAQVLEELVRGEATTTIAANLGIGERAVELHVTALFARLDVDSRARLVSTILLARDP